MGAMRRKAAGTMGPAMVVGTDGSEHSTSAVDWAADAAARHAVALRIVYASMWERYEGGAPLRGVTRSSEEALAECVVASAAERVARRQPRLVVATEIVPEDPARTLVAESEHAFAVVVGQRDRGEIAALLLGSVSLATATRARSPVFVVRGGESNREGRYRWITVAVAGDGRSREAVEFAFREAAVRGAGLEAVHAWRWPVPPEFDSGPDTGTAGERLLRAERLLEEALREPMARHPDVPVRSSALDGPARKVLLEAAAASDLLVVGARRRGGGFGLHLGPVNHVVLHHAPCPVAVVPEPG